MLGRFIMIFFVNFYRDILLWVNFYRIFFGFFSHILCGYNFIIYILCRFTLWGRLFLPVASNKSTLVRPQKEKSDVKGNFNFVLKLQQESNEHSYATKACYISSPLFFLSLCAISKC